MNDPTGVRALGGRGGRGAGGGGGGRESARSAYGFFLVLRCHLQTERN